MKNRDFRFFKTTNLPIMTSDLSRKLVEEIGSKLYDCQDQKRQFKIRMIEMFGCKCAYCGAPLDNNSAEQIDHFVPANDDNRNKPDNLLLTCFSCNNSKRKMACSRDFYPYEIRYSTKFTRDEYGFIVPNNIGDKEAFLFAEQLHFSSISKSLTYIYLLIDYLIELIEDRSDEQSIKLVADLSIFKRKLESCSKLLCLRESLK